MPYQRVWVPELNAFKIIGEDTGEYAQIYQQYPGIQQINISAVTGQIYTATPEQVQSGQFQPIPEGFISTIGQIADLRNPEVITPYTAPTPTPIQTTYTPTRNGTIDKGANVLGLGAVAILSMLIFALGRKK